MKTRLCCTAISLLAVAACGNSATGSTPDLSFIHRDFAAGADDLGAPSDDLAPSPDLASPPDDLSPPADLAGLCHAGAGDADRARKAVVSHPFSTSGGKGNDYEVLDLAASGTLTRANVHFSMGTGGDRPIRFTPDGAIGMVAQDDGSLGVFRFDSSGAPVVVNAAFRQGFYATDVVIAPDGARAFVVDMDTANNGGGVYALAIACDGTLTVTGHTTGDNATALAFLGTPGSDARALVTTRNTLGSPMGDDTLLVDLAGAPALVASGAAFPDTDAIPSSIAVMPDGRFALVTDNGIFAGNRVAVVALPSLKSTQLLTTSNPAQAVASPWGNAALVLNSDGKDALRVFAYDSTNGATPFSEVGQVTYKNGKPMLPSSAVVIARGALTGRTLVAENVAVRALQFHADGSVEDVGMVTFGSGLEQIVGSVGVQP